MENNMIENEVVVVVEKKGRGRPRKITDNEMVVSSSEARKIYNKRYYESKQKEILECQRETVVCECGLEIRKHRLAKHKQCKYHLSLMKHTEKTQ